MKVNFKAAQVLGNRSYNKGEQHVPDALAHNITFKRLVAKGHIHVYPRDAVAQGVQLSRDMEALHKAKLRRQKIEQAPPPAQTAPDAQTSPLSTVEAIQPLHTPAQPVNAGVAVEARIAATPAIANEKGD